MPDERLRIPVGAAARYLGTTPNTLRRWTDDGRIRAGRTPGGQRRYSIADLEQFEHEMYAAEAAERC